MQQPPKDESPLSPYRAFVVQFRAETDLGHRHCAGRVEHVVSGRATHFASLEELLAFMTWVLTTVRTPPSKKLRNHKIRRISMKAWHALDR
jgi:hypothetical protein